MLSKELEMIIEYLLPMARNTVTGETVKTQDLNGTRFTQSQKALALTFANRLAEDLSGRTGHEWRGFVKSYTPTARR
jgi:hypothetical protein